MVSRNKNHWEIKAYGWNKWGVYLNEQLVACSEERRDCCRFVNVPEQFRLKRLADDPNSNLRPLQLSTPVLQ